MKRLFLSFLMGMYYLTTYAQPTTTKWALPDNLNLISFKGLDSSLSVPDLNHSKADIEIRLYASGKHSNLRSMTSLIYKDNQLTATYYSRKYRAINDPVDAVFPVNISEIKHKKLDSVFFGLVKHNVFILPDQSQTRRPHTIIPYVILVKSNDQIRGYRFQSTSLIEERDSQEFREYKAIVGLFYYLNDGFPEKL
ncbi:hypothetical protein [Pedobacter sp. B4-66]|uniref:hypothetical protein n=1 Tax=Pedobacter sp. B4-66 TaxID=2817280 RepID=UPI001BD98B0B|nr:hypothetical protein [Pedobacter sp. B4-66]